MLSYVEGGKWCGATPLLGSVDIPPGATDSISCLLRGGGTVRKPLCDRTLMRGHKVMHNINNDCWMMEAGSDGGWEARYGGALTTAGPI